MASKAMSERVAEARKALFDEGFLDKQFEELESLQTPDDCFFVEDIFSLFYKEMGGLFSKVEKELGQDAPNTQVLDQVLHQIKGCTSGVGAKQVSIIGNEMREHAIKGEIQNCRDAFVQMQNQLVLLGQRMSAYFVLYNELLTGGAESSSSAAAKDGVKGKGKAT